MHTRLKKSITARDWNALPEMLAHDIAIDDRRRAVNSGIQYGRDAAIADMRGAIDLGLTQISLTVIAIRGARLELCRTCISGDDRPDAFRIEFLSVLEVNADERIVGRVGFDLDDIDAAFDELDARYLAGEAAAHANTWSAIMAAFTALNRHETFATTPDWIHVDHRLLARFEANDLAAYLRATWEVTPDITMYVEAVHRLSEVGVVLTHAAYGTSPEGFDAEWRMVLLLTVEGHLINRGEIFDEADLDAALARFDQLQPQARRLENAASGTYARFRTYFAARDWAAMAELLTVDTTVDDHRQVVKAEIRHGRDVEIANMRAFAEIGATSSTATVIATRGERLILCRACISGEDQQPGAFHIEFLNVVEIDSDARITARSAYDLDDIGPAFEELDARYIAGEAAPYAHTWSVIAGEPARFDRHELPAATPDPVYIDRRKLVSIEGVDLAASVRAVWDITSGASIHIEAVHRLTELGAVFTYVLNMTSHEGFDGEVSMIMVFTVEGDLISRVEVFDEADLDVALVRFDELQPQARRLKNAASQAYERFQAHFATSDWDAIADMLTTDLHSDDRRRVVGGGRRPGRDALIEDLQAVTDVEITNAISDAIATRGERLALARARYSRGRGEPDSFHVDFLQLVEIDAEGRITAFIAFDADDFDAAIEELDARYLAGEATPHARTWSLIAQAYSMLNRRDLPPAKADWSNVDHRRGIAFDPGDMAAYIRAGMELAPNTRIYIDTVHRLKSLGAVVTQVLTGTSHDGFDAEWREIGILTFEGDLISRSELYDEADIDAAIARFDELERLPQLPHNAATRTWARLSDAFNRRDVESFLALNTSKVRYEDRRPLLRDEFVGAAAQRKAVQAMFEVPDSVQMTAEPMATRGSRLALLHVWFRDTAFADRPVTVEMMQIVEVNDSGLLDYSVSFDLDNIDAAFAELDARYLVGEAAEHARTWSVMTRTCAAFNRGELPATTPDSVFVDHRPVLAVDAVDLPSYLRAMWDVTPDIRVNIEAVHRLSELGAVLTHAVNETSPEGFNAEWRGILICTLEGDRVSRHEVFDEADLDAALVRFDELNRPAS